MVALVCLAQVADCLASWPAAPPSLSCVRVLLLMLLSARRETNQHDKPLDLALGRPRSAPRRL